VNVQVKICGLGRPEDARVAEEAGADYLGVVFAASPRQRSESEARRIWRDTRASRVGVFVDSPEEELVARARRLGLSVVQLHGSEAPEYCRRVSGAGAWATWKAVRLKAGQRLEPMLERYSSVVDGLLLEGWSRGGQGGVGAQFDWSLAARVRNAWPEDLRLILAGGLGPGNVAEAIERVRPDIVDVSSGVEAAPGLKDPEAVLAFVEAVGRMSRGWSVK
jgi:phosphoribosylanthranilate isomerase